MKTAIIFYSYDRNCALCAGIMKSALNADVFEIKTVDSRRRKGFMKILWGASQVIFKKKPAIHPLSVIPENYDLIILGTPVWAGSPAPAIVSFLDKKKIAEKKVALFCCHGGGMGTVFEKLKALLPGNNFSPDLELKEPLMADRQEVEQKIRDWVKTIG